MKIFNRKYSREYEKVEEYEAGIALTGAEVKSVKSGNIKIDDAYVRIFNNEAYLVNANIPPYKFAKKDEYYDGSKRRRLLLHKRELIRIMTKMKSHGLTIIPIVCYNKHGLIKLTIALSKGKRDAEKRKYEKVKDMKMREKQEAKEYLKR